MNAYKKYLTIDDPNNLVLSGLPFASGQRVEIIILSDNNEATITETENTAKTINSEEFLLKANQAYTDLRNNPEAWQEELAERELWEETIADGVIED
jgi:hypothetical protein